MDRRQLLLATIISLTTSLSGHRLYAEEDNDPALFSLMANAKVSLQDGLETATTEGQPISAKFEVDDGKLQLSVYTVEAGKFYEVIADHTTGKVSKTEEITEGEDLSAAKSQNEAMRKATTDLKTATSKSAVDPQTEKDTVAFTPYATLKDLSMWQRIHPDDRDRVYEGAEEALRRKGTTRLSSKSYCLMEQSNILKQPAVTCFPRPESFSKLSAHTSM